MWLWLVVAALALALLVAVGLWLRRRSAGEVGSGPAPAGLEYTGSRSFQIFWTLTAAPCVTLPLLAVEGLPVGVQVMGFRDRDADLLSLAGWIDQLPSG